MLLHIVRLLKGQDTPSLLEEKLNFSSADFPGYEITDLVECKVRATTQQSIVKVVVTASAKVVASCARCLQEAQLPIELHKEYLVRMSDVEEEFPELPILSTGELDIKELVYQDLLMDVPSIILCNEECQGLCSSCGKLVAECSCEKEEELDPRWQALRDLLQ